MVDGGALHSNYACENVYRYTDIFKGFFTLSFIFTKLTRLFLQDIEVVEIHDCIFTNASKFMICMKFLSYE